MGVHILLGLPARVADLRPEMIAIAGGRGCPSGESVTHHRIGFTVYDDVTRALQVIAIDYNIARQQQPGRAQPVSPAM